MADDVASVSVSDDVLNGIEIDKDIDTSEEENAVEEEEINQRLFKRSFWDQLPMKRNNKHTNKTIRPDFDWDYSNNTFTKEAVSLPRGYEWFYVNFSDEKELQTVCDFIHLHFNHSRVYTTSYMKWLFSSPTWKRTNATLSMQNSIIGVRTKNQQKIVGLISYRPIVYRIDNQHIQTFYIDFLCVHTHLRGKHLSKVLMKECFRTISQSSGTTGLLFHTKLSMPFYPIVQPASCLVYSFDKHKPIKPSKDLNLIRFATKEDLPKMLDIYNQYSNRFRLQQSMTLEELEYYMLPANEHFVHTYVITNSLGEIKDFVCIYSHYSSTGKHVAYVHTITFINDLLLKLFTQNILYILQTNGFKEVVVSNIKKVSSTLEKLGFEETDQKTYTYIFDYNTKTIATQDCSLAPLL
jgi:L-amino acid N-acyltransferase YncA/ribosomal protein S18 acetylase RimI-like enzyme